MNALRLLPLISSATEIVHALGLGEYQVGRSHECDFPSSVLDLPVCTRPNITVDGSSAEIDRLVKERLATAVSVYQVHSEVVAALRPTHIFTQTQCKVCAVSLDDVERALQKEIATEARVVALEPFALEDVWADVRRVATACDRAATGEELVGTLKGRLSEICGRAHSSHLKPTVAAIEWLEPVMVAGNWVPELIDMAGGRDLFGQAGGHSPYVDWDEIIKADPEIIIAMPCGFDLERSREEMHWLTDRPGWRDLRAVRHHNIFVCDGNQFMNRPGPRLVESAQIFAEIFHPELFIPKLEGTGWQRFSG